jgi:uncharacterized protein YbaA (DUF1428 family)
MADQAKTQKGQKEILLNVAGTIFEGLPAILEKQDFKEPEEFSSVTATDVPLGELTPFEKALLTLSVKAKEDAENTLNEMQKNGDFDNQAALKVVANTNAITEACQDSLFANIQNRSVLPGIENVTLCICKGFQIVVRATEEQEPDFLSEMSGMPGGLGAMLAGLAGDPRVQIIGNPFGGEEGMPSPFGDDFPDED